jgi:hypothetical protein
MPDFVITESEKSRRKTYDDLIQSISKWVAGDDDLSIPDDVRSMRMALADGLRVKFAQAAPLSAPILEFEGVTGTPTNEAARRIPRIERNAVDLQRQRVMRTPLDGSRRPPIAGELARSSRSTPVAPGAPATEGVGQVRRRRILATARPTVTIRRVM